MTSHDLVGEIYLFFQALEPELDVNNVDQAIKAVETLTELVQGNYTYGNAQLLLQTKLVSILERLIDKTSLDGAIDGGVGAVELSELRVQSLTLLLALLEGSTTEPNRARMLRVLELPGLARAVAKSFGQASALADDDPCKELDTQSAYLRYMLLTNLKDWQEQKDGLLPGQSDAQTELPEETKAVLDETVCAIEIVNVLGELEVRPTCSPAPSTCSRASPFATSATSRARSRTGARSASTFACRTSAATSRAPRETPCSGASTARRLASRSKTSCRSSRPRSSTRCGTSSRCRCLLLVASGCFWLLLVASGCFWLLLINSEYC